MLNEFSKAWNSLYHDHLSEYATDSVTIVEKGKEAKNKTFTVRCAEAVSFPSKQFDGYDMFGALSNRNCDGAFLILNDEGSYDLVYVEMKSRFDSHETFEAKCQIVETRAKMQSLFQMLQAFPALHLRKVFGVIEHQKLDHDQEDLWSKLQLLPDERLDFGWRLIKYGVVEVVTHCNPELSMPSEMTFKIVLSDEANYTVNYSDLCIY